MKKIPCVVFTYYNVEIIKKSIEFLIKYNDILDIIVVENNSSYTDKELKPYFLQLLDEGKIIKYVLFEENISNNALQLVFKYNIIKNLEDYDYILVTDGDVVIKTDGWLNEELNIMNDTKIFTCGAKVDMSNLPLNTHPEAKEWWRLEHLDEYGNKYYAFSGMQLLLMRTHEFKNYIKYIEKNHLKFIDETMNYFCYKVLNKRWAFTKENIAYHLAWDLYKDADNPYHILRYKEDEEKTPYERHRDLWFHNRYCPFEVFTRNSYRKVIPYKEIEYTLRNHILENHIDKAKSLINKLEQNEYISQEQFIPYKAIIILLENNYAEVEKILVKGLKKYEKNFALIYNLAYVYEIKGDYERSLILYQDAKKLCRKKSTSDYIDTISLDLNRKIHMTSN